MGLHHTLAVGYIRGVVGDYASLDRQRERITALCAWQPPPLHCIIDEAPEMVSTPLADRPGGTDLLTLLCARIWLTDSIGEIFYARGYLLLRSALVGTLRKRGDTVGEF